VEVKGIYSRIDVIGLQAENGVVYARSWSGKDKNLSTQDDTVTPITMTNKDNVITLTKAGVSYKIKYVAHPIGTYYY